MRLASILHRRQPRVFLASYPKFIVEIGGTGGFMIDSSLRGAEPPSEPTGVRPASLHSNIEQAIRDEMRSIRTLEALPSTLREDLRSICVSAKSLDMRAELLVIAIKKVWQEIPEARSCSRPMEVDALLNDVVTMTLDEFYRASAVLPGRDD